MTDYITNKIQLSSLRPFARNSEIFSDSLGEDSIRALAEDLKKHGLAQPVSYATVSDDDGLLQKVIVDGHRRYLAACMLGWTHIEGRDLGAMTAEEIEARILDCYSSARQASPREKAALFTAQLERLQREHGRTHGGDRSDQDGGSPILKGAELRAEAASRVGISSEDTARKLVRIFKEAPEGIQTAVNQGDLSISAAIDQLPSTRAQKPKPVRPSVDSGPTPGGFDDFPPGSLAVDPFRREPTPEPTPEPAPEPKEEPSRRVIAPSGDAEKLVRGLLQRSETLARDVCHGLMIHFGFAEKLESGEADLT